MAARSNLAATVAALLTTAALLGFGVMSFQDNTGGTKPVVVPFDLFWCAKDDDCIAVERIGCCSCEEGGAQGAVTRWHADDIRLFLKSACRPRPVCIQLDLCRNDTKAICEDRHCRLVPDPSKHVKIDKDAPSGAVPETP
jgi:hypothetical protein